MMVLLKYYVGIHTNICKFDSSHLRAKHHIDKQAMAEQLELIYCYDFKMWELLRAYLW